MPHYFLCIPDHVHSLLLQVEHGARDLHGAGEHCLQGQGGHGDDTIDSDIISDTPVYGGGG